MKTFVLIITTIVALTSSSPKPPDDKICLSAEELKLYKLIISYRKKKGLPSIPLSSKLTKVAQIHAKDLSENYDPDGGTCNLHSWSKNGKWTACCYTPDHQQAECMWNKPKEIAGYSSNGYEISYYNQAGASAEEGIGGWQKSKGHNEVMTNQGIWKQIKWKAIGIGLYKGYGVVWFGEVEDEEKIGTCP
jgi:uncharacterized protein YkwD